MVLYIIKAFCFFRRRDSTSCQHFMRRTTHQTLLAINLASQQKKEKLLAFVVPIICDTPQSQSVVQAILTYAHLKGLKLADYHAGRRQC